MKKTYTSREFKKVLNKNGFIAVRTNGDHQVFRKGNQSLTINLINLNRMVAKRLIKEYNLIVDY